MILYLFDISSISYHTIAKIYYRIYDVRNSSSCISLENQSITNLQQLIVIHLVKFNKNL